MLETYVTVGPKSQVVIPKKVRKIASKLRPGKKVLVRPLSANAVMIEVKPTSWTKETYGMHKDIWQGIEATEYIHNLRKEWMQNRYQ